VKFKIMLIVNEIIFYVTSSLGRLGQGDIC
jgi:hypothetical protein